MQVEEAPFPCEVMEIYPDSDEDTSRETISAIQISLNEDPGTSISAMCCQQNNVECFQAELSKIVCQDGKETSERCALSLTGPGAQFGRVILIRLYSC